MAYVRKTHDEYEIECFYTESGSWEYVLTAENHRNARDILKDYRNNDPHPYRIKKRRVPNN